MLPNILLLCSINVLSELKTANNAHQLSFKSTRIVEHKLPLAARGDTKLFTFIIPNMSHVLL